MNKDPQFGRVFALAGFPLQDPEKQVILPSWFPRHLDVPEDVVRVSAFGLDIAASEHGDETVLAAGGQNGIKGLHVTRFTSTMEIVGWVLEIAIRIYGIDLRQQRLPITVDMDGLGKGVGDRLNELAVKVRPFHGAAMADRPQQYRNRRAEVYGELAGLDPKGRWPDTPWRLPDDPMLLDELVASRKGLWLRWT